MQQCVSFFPVFGNCGVFNFGNIFALFHNFSWYIQVTEIIQKSGIYNGKQCAFTQAHRMSDHSGNNRNANRMLIYEIRVAADGLGKMYFVVQRAEMASQIFCQRREVGRHFAFADIHQIITQTEHIKGLQLFKFLFFSCNWRKRFCRLQYKNADESKICQIHNILYSQLCITVKQ